MPRLIKQLNRLLETALVASGLCLSVQAKSYSGGGHSYSSHSSHSSSFSSGSHSFSSGSSHSSSSGWGGGGGSSHGSTFTWSGTGSGGGKSFNSGSRSYSSGSIWDDGNRKSYSSGKSYTSGVDTIFGSAFKRGSGNLPASGSSSHFSFDTAAAHARKEESSKQEFTRFKDSQTPPIIRNDAPGAATPTYGASPQPLPSSSGGYYRPTPYIPDYRVFSTRPVRIYNVFNPYITRPVVVYHDPYSSLFWWWLLDRSLDDRTWWAYNHRYDMDPDRYQALLAQDQQLGARVAQLEAQQTPRDANYVPAGVDRDLMYSDQYVARAYANRPTFLGVAFFRLLGVSTAITVTGFFIWLIWFKRWQVAPSTT